MSDLRVIREWKPGTRLTVPEEMKELYPTGVFSFVNPNHPGFINKVSSDSGVEIVKVTDAKIKAKYGMCIEPGTNFYRIGDALLVVQHKETKAAKDKYIQDLVNRKLPKVVKKRKDSFNETNPLAKEGKIITDVTVETTRGGVSETLSV